MSSTESLEQRLAEASLNRERNQVLTRTRAEDQRSLPRQRQARNDSAPAEPKATCTKAGEETLSLDSTISRAPEEPGPRYRPTQFDHQEEVSRSRPASTMQGNLKPRLLLMGQRRSGKSSITHVVFHKHPPQETIFIESTTRILKEVFESFMDFQIWDFPGQLDYFDPAFDSGDIFKNIGALIWVIDAQDDYNDSLNRLVVTIMNLQSTEYRDILVEVFIHKTDGLPDEIKGDVYTDITSRVSDELADAGYINPRVTYHVTSIFDSSIFEALSRVIQKLIPELNTLQNLLNILADNTGMEKVYLFDINSKIYVASDTRPVDMGSYEMSSAMIDFVLDTIDLFNYPRKNPKPLGAQMDEVEASVTFSHDASLMLILKEVNRYLTLVGIIKAKDAKDKKGLIDYNVHILSEAVNKVFAVKETETGSKSPSEEEEQPATAATAAGNN